jgi:hypothetical protein
MCHSHSRVASFASLLSSMRADAERFQERFERNLGELAQGLAVTLLFFPPVWRHSAGPSHYPAVHIARVFWLTLAVRLQSSIVEEATRLSLRSTMPCEMVGNEFNRRLLSGIVEIHSMRLDEGL